MTAIRGGARRLAVVAGLAVTSVFGANARLAAQSPASLTVAGRVVRQVGDRSEPVARTWVVLHRITPDQAGPLDSMRTDAHGAFRFVVRPDSGAMYLASAQHAGIAYFSPPSGGGMAASPEESEIAVFDTTSADVPLQLQGRHLVVSLPNANGVRSVIDVLEIENTGHVTRVAAGDARPSFALRIPDAARAPRASQGGGGEAPLVMRDGRAHLLNPLSPGLRQVVVTYELDAAAFPLSLALEHAPGMLEVLLEDTTATASGAALAAEGVVSVDGRSFARFLSRQVPAKAVVRVAMPSPRGGSRIPPWLLPLVLALAALGALVVGMRRSGGDVPRLALDAPVGGEPPDSARALARAAATLDALLSSPTSRLDATGRDALRAERESLAKRLREVLARRTPVR